MADARLTTTAEDLLRLSGSGKRYELIAGELIELAPAGGEHGYVAARALVRLSTFVDQHRVGGAVFAAETGFRLARNPDTVRAPDAAYVSAARLVDARVRAFPDLAPDLVVEIVSPSDTASDVHEKVGTWLASGVQVAIVLYPVTRSAIVFRPDGEARVLHEDDILTAEPVLPDFSCRVGDFF